ncbi:MAG: NAD(+)/NADH kinase [Anaerolineaceae bacterium]|nr:NAD(+)/NADH kinase [Anaerolineaceae bacterium]
MDAPKRIAVLTYVGLQNGPSQAEAVANFLRQTGVDEVVPGTLQDSTLAQRVEEGDFDMVVTLGGDGTMLRAGHLCAPSGTPILGINLGRFGFLTEIQRGEWGNRLDQLLGGNFRIEERMLLQAEHVRRQKSLGSWLVVNEVVICRGQFVRPIRVKACVDGYTMASIVADGVIAATATGSTAYALAAGGPIMPPELRNMLIIPVAPHLSLDRAVILSEGACVELTAYTDHEAVMSVDGHTPLPLLDGDSVRVSASNRLIRFVRFQDPGYFYRNISAYMEQNPSAGNVK